MTSAASSKLTCADRERLLAWSFANADLLLELDGCFAITYATGALHHLAERDEQALIGASFIELLEPQDRHVAAAMLGALAPDTRLRPFDTGLSVASGDDAPVTLSGYRLGQEAPRWFVTLKRRVRAPAELERRRRADKQSGLMTVCDFVEAAQSAVPGAHMNLIELGGFDALVKRIDPAKLDAVMAEVGAILTAAVAEQGSAARLGPDKLGAVCDASVDVDTVKASIRKLSQEADPIGAGFDVAHWAVPMDDAGLGPEQASQVLRYAITRFAERGLNEWKPTSMNEVMRHLVQDTVARTIRALNTISQGGIEIAYQPIVDMRDRRVHHWEALSRLREEASPASMVQFAEQVGLVGEFDLMVCSKVISAVEKANARGLKPLIAINLSASSLENPAFLQAFDLLLKPYPLTRPQIMIEITETAALKDLAKTESVIQHLRRQGHKVCLDDFGVGAAGFRYIQKLTFDWLKIDGSISARSPTSGRDFAILRAIAQMCRELKIATVAEMIETEHQARCAAQAGVNFAQGFLFGKPNIAEDFSLPAAPCGPQNTASAWR
jgi:EAL domain-containing protein (putative c-di-GMP-specific phosphodiesterase class I)